MKTNLFTVRKPSRSDWMLMATLWAMAFPFMVMGNLNQPWWLIGLGWLVNVAVHTGIVLVIVYWLFPTFLFTRRYWLLFSFMLVALLGFATLDQLYIWLAYHHEGAFQWRSILYSLVSIAPQAGVLAAVLAGKQFFETQERLVRTEKERVEAELRHLKAQIDPHFLFNNLNVLASLIERNPQQASAYLYRFSALYRFLIRHKDEDVVALADELTFLDDYMYLIRQRFGRAYELLTTVRVPDTLAVLVLPGSIQTLVENAVKHNQASETDPLLIELTITSDAIVVRNERRAKLTPVESTGTGLKNLESRYKLLSDQAVSVQTTATEFRVSLPTLHSANMAPTQPLATRL
ncbi:histidine kinase [Spirosoma sp.]|uniref:sensor histidine kinase n=1 Tax=Spirosoma sp. TaxID=1899569 RepID=UPI00261625E4|nr:histidine kinase [Spirosoma sp.]MCX6219036.1 histidine kinase [Spirosoma sp.]